MPKAPALGMSVQAHDAEQDILALSDQTMRVISIAAALAESARPVDLDGLQDQVGLLCAKALDLPPGQTGFAKLELRRLVDGLDSLKEAMGIEPA